MANQEQLKILNKGAPTWNEWRTARGPEIIPDLSEANPKRRFGDSLKAFGMSAAEAILRGR